MKPTSLKLEFDTPQFLQGLIANDRRNLTYLEDALELKVVTRDGWIAFNGSELATNLAEKVFQDLETTQRNGRHITERDFHLAVDIAKKSGEIPLNSLSTIKLVGSKSRKTVSPRTPNQLAYVKAIQDNDVSFGLGPAGTGKTYLAMAVGLHMLKKREIQRIILTRPAVEAGEALGFLPGDLKEKVAPYLRPLYDAINDMLDPEEAQRYLEEQIIEIAPLAYMRGRTLSRAFVILDEAQNTTREQMFMTLTRLGEQSKIVITGDSSQIDLKHNIPSGLHEAEHALKNINGISFTRFAATDIVRHPIVEHIVTAYEKFRS
ncbi:PhoH family protein [Luteolibacter sp. AS25]|uniref:PhoH family protein n=1 Tax=Luteolibacter sp. AS25 TaxID=3135776 RepID=UPI00398AF42B